MLNVLTTYLIVLLAITACSEEKESKAPQTIEELGPEPSSAPPTPALRRLTIPQYKNAIADIFGDGLTGGISLEPDTEIHGQLSTGSSITSVSPAGVERYEEVSFSIAEQVVESEDRRDQLPCVPNNTTDEECFSEVVQHLGRIAYRRPIVEAERNRLTALISTIAQDSDDPWMGIEFGIAAILQSPHFLYRTEHGDDNGMLTDFEWASRASFLLWNSIPDDTLLIAAEQGKLGTHDGRSEQVDRMINSPKINQGIRSFFSEIFSLYDLDDLTKDPSVFNHASPELGPAAREEILLGLEALILEEDDDFRNILTTRRTFVDRRLAALYNIAAPVPEGFGETWLPDNHQRRGFLGMAGFLALNSHSTGSSATLRGVFIRKKLLCQLIPPPPADIDTSIPEASADAPTLRERIESHLEDPSCSGCHQVMDLPGLGLENFNGIGQWRDTENGAEIDPSGTIDGQSFDSAWSLADTLRNHRNLIPCFSQHLHQYATGHPKSDGVEATLDWLSQSFAIENHSFITLLRRLALSENFRKVGDVQ